MAQLTTLEAMLAAPARVAAMLGDAMLQLITLATATLVIAAATGLATGIAMVTSVRVTDMSATTVVQVTGTTTITVAAVTGTTTATVARSTDTAITAAATVLACRCQFL